MDENAHIVMTDVSAWPGDVSRGEYIPCKENREIKYNVRVSEEEKKLRYYLNACRECVQIV